jgi:hypothetical protein
VRHEMLVEATKIINVAIVKIVSCGPDVTVQVAAARPFAEAGFTDLALVQIGGALQHQEPFFDYARDELPPALRTEFGVG